MLVCFSPCPRIMWISGFNQKYCLSEHIIKQERQEGISLGVQWFRLLWPNTGDAGSIPGQGTMIHMLGSAAKKEREAKKWKVYATECYPKTGFTSWWVSSQKTQSSQRSGEGRIYYYFQQARRTPGSFPKQCLLEQQSWGSFKLRVCAYSGRRNGKPLQYPCLENSMDWWATVHGVAKSQT